MVTALVALGLIVLSSASVKNGEYLYGDSFHFMKRQFVHLALGLFIAVFASWFDYRKWREHWILPVLLYGGVFVLLLAVFGFKEVNGSYRWIALGPVRLQPSEFAKVTLVIVLSVWMSKVAWRVELFKEGALWPIVLIGGLALPVILEPDFGSVMVMGAVGILIMFVAGTRLLHLLPFVVGGVAIFAFRVLTNENRLRRLMAFFDPSASNDGSYQANMSLVAIKNGGIWGVGLGSSMQKEGYLPENHTDFIFSIGAEELGLIFTIGVILLYVLFFALSVYIARKSTDRFGRFLVVGMSFLVFFQAMFNLGVVCEALPTKGMALPFFSYGGTNMLTSFFAVGTILSVGIHSFTDRKRRLSASVHAR